jgi:hypothetical protein
MQRSLISECCAEKKNGLQVNPVRARPDTPVREMECVHWSYEWLGWVVEPDLGRDLQRRALPHCAASPPPVSPERMITSCIGAKC